MAFFRAMPWHEGEAKIHKLTRVPEADNPTNPGLTSFLARRVAASPLVALGTTDGDGRVWCTVWGGNLPVAQQVAAGGILGIRARVDASYDPVVQALYESKDDGEVLQHDTNSAKLVSGLSIHLEERDRVKLFGLMLAGSLSSQPSQDAVTDRELNPPPNLNGEHRMLAGHGASSSFGKVGDAQLVVQITQSLGNCPKYINKKSIAAHPSHPQLLCNSSKLSDEAIAHVLGVDTFFIASKGPEDLDCNIRGGAPGFVRVQQSDGSSTKIIYPEYSGNNLVSSTIRHGRDMLTDVQYQSLGNITFDPRVGVVMPNFLTGDVLYLSGTAEVLIGEAANSIIAKTKLAVRFTVQTARFVRDGLNFRGTVCSDNKDVSSSNPVVSRSITDGQSPYNPRLRYLRDERPSDGFTAMPPDEYRDRYQATSGPELLATLVKKTRLTPTVTRYRFRLDPSNGSSFDAETALWTPGQYVALDFSDELYLGYSHMNDSDPTALNDDFIRTFTVSSVYQSTAVPEFELVVRSVGPITKWLAHQNDRGNTQIGVKGFSGDFKFDLPSESDHASNVFIAAGIGITPLLGHVRRGTTTGVENLLILWTLNVADIGLAQDVMATLPHVVLKQLKLFVTGTDGLNEGDQRLDQLRHIEGAVADGGIHVHRRRLEKDDLISLEQDEATRIRNWYLCTAPAMRKTIQQWLGTRTIIFENFDY